ncbi:MAG TPA: acyltransferase family protein, partial [Bryobacteraceae bacterium]|nr:acyltransferase family protein [Bryobacteraceae bacterium]
KPLLHLWSLGIEEQFYLLWPLLLYIAWKLRLRFPLLILPVLLVSFGLNVATVQSDNVAAFYSPLTRFWELMIGSMFAYGSLLPRNPDGALPGGKRKGAALLARLTVARDLQAPAGILFIVVSVFALNREQNFPGWRAALPTVGAVLLLSAGPEAWFNRRVLSNRAMVLVGLVSYPLYLWHWPFLSFARIVGNAAPTVGTRMGAILASLIAAWITYKVVEIPIRSGTYGSVKVLCLAALMLAMGGIGTETMEHHGLASRMRARAPELLQQYARIGNYDLWTKGRYRSCWLTEQQPADTFSEECVDHGQARPLVFVWGDSHAARLFVGLRKTIGDRVRLAQYTRDACPPIVDFGYPNCAHGNRFVLSKLQEARPDTAILFAVWNHYMQQWKQDLPAYQQLDQTISEIEKLGTRQVIVVGAPPQWRKDLPRTLLEFYNQDVPLHRVPRRMRFGLDLEARRAAESLESLLRSRTDITYVSAWDAFCDKDGCLTRVDDKTDGITTVDYGHFTDTTAEYFANKLPLPPIQSAR